MAGGLWLAVRSLAPYVLRRYGGESLERCGGRLPVEHRKVLDAIPACRTGALGTVHCARAICGRTQVKGRSCGNRLCPTCQPEKTRAGRKAQTAHLLPCPCFLLNFTLPAELRDLTRSHQRVACAALFRSGQRHAAAAASGVNES